MSGHENRLSRLTTMSQVIIAIGLMLLASQGALWLEVGKVSSAMTQLNGKVDLMNSKVDLIARRVAP